MAPLFITFEGIDGSGKTTQVRLLRNRLQERDLTVVATKEPGGTDLGRILRIVVKREKLMHELFDTLTYTEGWSLSETLDPRAEMFLFAAARAQLVSEVILPSLKQGITVICDRYTDSTLAYQGWGRCLDLDIIKIVNNIATQGLKPDITILLDLPVAEALNRGKKKIAARFEEEELAFHQRVRKGYHQLAAAEPRRWIVIDGALLPEEVAHKVWEEVKPFLS
ncbi:MAG: dTMP kinase [Chloroflexi bacterium]|nr:dTMP kinase [Chloroflexota bacterium]